MTACVFKKIVPGMDASLVAANDTGVIRIIQSGDVIVLNAEEAREMADTLKLAADAATKGGQ